MPKSEEYYRLAAIAAWFGLLLNLLVWARAIAVWRGWLPVP